MNKFQDKFMGKYELSLVLTEYRRELGYINHTHLVQV